MVGHFPIAPHHDPLQYIHHIHLTQMESKPGCYTDFNPFMSSLNAIGFGSFMVTFFESFLIEIYLKTKVIVKIVYITC